MNSLKLLSCLFAALFVASGCVLIVSPDEFETIALPGTITGVAYEADGIDSVRLRIQSDEGRYWNGGAWQDDSVEVYAVVDDPSTTTSVWHYDFWPSRVDMPRSFTMTGVSYHGGIASEAFDRRFQVLDAGDVMFFDDFEGDEVDPEKWKIYQGGTFGAASTFNPTESCFGPENVGVEHGALVITARREVPAIAGCESKTWTSGMVMSNDDRLPAADFWRGNLGFNQGRIEMRARWDAKAGMWPGFWMRPATQPYGPWPFSGEVDILESRGNLGIAKGGIVDHNRNNPFDDDRYELSPEDAGRYHHYRVDWTDEAFRFYFDEELIHETDMTGQPYDLNFFLTFTFTVGSFFPGASDPADDKAQMFIDWVRVSRLE